MTGEPPLAQQQRAVVELYVRSKWIKASLAIEDENLFIEYAHNKQDQQPSTGQSNNTNSNEETTTTTQNNGSTNNFTPDTITSQKRTIKITKPDNTGLGKHRKEAFVYSFLFHSRNQYQRWTRKSNAYFNQ